MYNTHVIKIKNKTINGIIFTSLIPAVQLNKISIQYLFIHKNNFVSLLLTFGSITSPRLYLSAIRELMIIFQLYSRG